MTTRSSAMAESSSARAGPAGIPIEANNGIVKIARWFFIDSPPWLERPAKDNSGDYDRVLSMIRRTPPVAFARIVSKLQCCATAMRETEPGSVLNRRSGRDGNSRDRMSFYRLGNEP